MNGASWWPRSDGAPPLYATRRNPDLPSDGSQVAVIAKSLGTPFIPWQRYVAEVANERRPDGSYEHQVVVVSVPRQTGKTTLIRANGVHTCLVCGRDVFYTAQTGKDARARWMDMVNLLRVHPALSDRIKIGLRGGAEQVAFRDGGAFHTFAPTPESLHGYTPHKVKVDESFALSHDAGELLMGAIGPAQITVIDKQIWLVSTRGTAEATFFEDWIQRAMDGTPRVAGFIWGAAEHHDPYDLDDIAQFHPGVGFPLNGKILTAEDVRAEADKLTRAEYERAFANRRTMTFSSAIPADRWRTLTLDELPAPTGNIVLAYDVAHDRQAGTVIAVWQHGSRLVGKVVRHEPGTGWMAAAITDLRRSLRPIALTAAGNGPVLDVTAQLTTRGETIDVLSERDYSAAASAFLSLVDQAVIGHDGDRTILEPAITGLVPVDSGDGMRWSRRHSVGDTSAAIGFTIGAWTLRRHQATGKPLVYFKTA